MKPKRITKKLSLSRNTIANLKASKLSNVKGAGNTYTCDFTCFHGPGTACYS
jgi:hypothetical protein